MKKNVLICLLSVLWAGMVLCVAAQGGGHGREEVPVKVEFESISLEREVSGNREGWHESPLKLKFNIRLSVRDEWRFVESLDPAKQYLSLTDSSGATLAPVEFGHHYLFQSIREGVASTSITGTAGGVPASGVSWLRLHGTFKVSLARLKRSPAYEFPLREGAEIYFPLPVEARNEADGDIVTAPEAPAASLSLKEYGRIEKDGKKMSRVKIIMKTEIPFEPETFQMVNEKGEAQNAECRDVSFSVGGKVRRWEKDMLFEDAGNARKLRLCLLYRVPEKLSAVPVDFKVGMGGEISKGEHAGLPVEERRPSVPPSGPRTEGCRRGK